MKRCDIDCGGGKASGYVVPCGAFNIVFAVSDAGLIGCGAFDVGALDRFDYPAAAIGSPDNRPIASVEDLLNGVVRRVNQAAVRRGIQAEMTGREALSLM